MRIGYARVSTPDQRLDLQHEPLKVAGCEKVYDDTASGRVAERPGLLNALRILRSGTSARDVAVSLCVSVPTLYRWLPATDGSNDE